VSISRSIATRLLEGMRLLLVSDADIADPTKFRGGVHVGPLVPDATDGDPIIAPRQINLMFAPNLVIDQFFSSHAGQATIPVIIAFYAPYSKEAINVSSGVNEYDYFEHIQKVLANGTEGVGNGKIVNPDDPTNPSAILKYLNVAAPTFRTTLMGVAVNSEKQENIARCYAAIAVYETREDIVTRGRA
jgi:hypothetical protein